MAQLILVKNKGLYTSPNELSSVPDGAMLRANNCIITVDNICEPRRGFDRVAELPLADDRYARFEFYQDQHLATWSLGKIGYKNSGVFTALTGTFNDPDSLLARRRFLLASSCLYLTTAAGVYKLDAYNGTPTLAGVPKGLDLNLSLSGSSGFMATANQVAYRVLWGLRDAQNNLILGAPSGRANVANGTGSSRDVAVTFTVPSGITTSHFFQVYRSAVSGGVSIEPDDELGLVYENNPSAGELTAGVVSFTDRTTDDLRGATIYTALSQEGIAQSNDRPPMCQDFEEFESCIVYANTSTKHRKTFTILATTGSAGIAFSDTISIAGTTYTFEGTENTATGKIALYGSSTTTGDTTNGNPTITNVASILSARVGKAIAGTGIPASTFIGSIGASTFGLVNAAGVAVNATATNAGVTLTLTDGTPAQNIADTAASLVRVVNRYATNTLVYAYYLSAPGDLPGMVLVEERGLGGASFALTASARGTAYNPVLPTSGTTVSSSNDDFQNGLMFSKTEKSEAVPLSNVRRVGSANNAIRRVKKLRNSCFIFKDREGLYRMTGTAPENFVIELFDSSAKLLAPDSLAVVNNQIWCLTDQGITVVTETGVSVVSRPIEDLILDQFGLALNAVKYYSFGVGYETERQYLLWTVSTSADTVASQCFVFNIFTQSYTRWPMTRTTGMVSPVDDKLYLGSGSTFDLEQERKSRNYTDYVDYGSDYTITSSSGTTVYLTTSTEIEAGDLLYQSATVQSLITEVQPGYVVVQDSITWANGTATVFKGIECELEYSALTGGNPGTAKQFPEVSMLFKAARFYSATVGFATDASGYFEDVTIYGSRTGLWGLFPWGSAAWGSTSTTIPIRTYVPLEKQRGSLLRVRFTHRQGYGYFKLLGLSLPIRDTGSFVIAK